jgi:hypothetical protein
MLNKTTYAQRNMEARSRNNCCRGEAVSVQYYECVSVAFVIQHAERMRLGISSSVLCLALPYCSTLSHKLHDFRKKKKWLNIKCVFWSTLQLLPETFLVLRRIQWDIMIKVYRSSCKIGYPLVLSNFNETWIFLDRFSKNTRISNFMKIRPVGGEMVHAGGWTDRPTDKETYTTKPTVTFRNTASAPEDWTFRAPFMSFV